MIPLEQAQREVLTACQVLTPRTIATQDLLGLVLAEAITANEQVPPFNNSAVDGYAVIADDVATPPATLAVVDDVPAGSASTLTLRSGQAIRIMTGAPVPDGADAVVMVERTTTTDDRATVTIEASVRPADNVRFAGSDIGIGERLYEIGTEVTPPVRGVLASINVSAALAIPRPRVAVIATGDELVTDGAPLAPGQIRESNVGTLTGMLSESGCDVRNMGVIPDDEPTLEAALHDAASDCDAIVTSGGVSMGDYDVVKAVLGRIAKMNWMQVAIKPAKPFAFGTLGDVPVFGLPGNPVSALVSYEMFARPALRKMAGYSRLSRSSAVAIADEPLERRVDGRVHLDRVNASFGDDGRLHVVPARAQGSHQLAATSLANALAVVPDGETIPAGAEVAVLMLR